MYELLLILLLYFRSAGLAADTCVISRQKLFYLLISSALLLVRRVSAIARDLGLKLALPNARTARYWVVLQRCSTDQQRR